MQGNPPCSWPLPCPNLPLQDTTEATRLEFLPHHFLLCSVGATGVLRYQDTSTGQVVATHRTRQGACDVLRQNPWNGVLCLGHGNGTVTMWTPNITTPVVRMLCHHGPVRSLAADTQGRHLATTGADGQASARQLLLLLRSSMLLLLAVAPPEAVALFLSLPHPPSPLAASLPPPTSTPPHTHLQVKVWDLRMLRPLHAYFSPSPAECCDISQRGLLAVGYGRRVQVWRDVLGSKAQSPYMTHTLAGGTLRDLRFCPYEVRPPGSPPAMLLALFVSPLFCALQQPSLQAPILIPALLASALPNSPTLWPLPSAIPAPLAPVPPAGCAGHRPQRRRVHHAGPRRGRAQLRLVCGKPFPDQQAAARGGGAQPAGQAAGEGAWRQGLGGKRVLLEAPWLQFGRCCRCHAPCCWRRCCLRCLKPRCTVEITPPSPHPDPGATPGPAPLRSRP